VSESNFDERDPGFSGSSGPSTDAHGDPVIDPTRNVLDLVAAAIKRQDDLREVESEHVREILTLRAEQRQGDVEHLEDMAALRADHDKELREAEAARIDAIRAVDVGAVNRAAEVATTQATTLAAQVATSAETLRTQVAAAASAQTIALAAALEPVQKDIADLRRAQYEAQGQKTQVVESRSGISSLTGIVGAIIATILVVLALYAASHRTSTPSQPIVVNVPATTTTTPTTTTTTP
jgi:cobalamin biosynthesis Mg chelatase CobN